MLDALYAADAASDAAAIEQPQEVEVVIESQSIADAPTEPDPLAKEWSKRIDAARKHWKPFFERCAHNRKLVAGFDWDGDSPPDDGNFYGLRANLILAAIAGMMPNLYARAPEMSVVPCRPSDAESGRLEKFTTTLSSVLNVYLDKAKLKERGKAAVRAALTCSYGIVKVVYQRDIDEDPIIQARIQDAQDNLQHVDGLLSRMTDTDAGCEELRATKAELEQTIAGLLKDVEARRMDGLVIDRVLTDQLIFDPSIVDFDDYDQADWMAQVIPMSRKHAEEVFKIKLTGAKRYTSSLGESLEEGAGSGGSAPGGFSRPADSEGPDDQICVLEVWDRLSQRVYTMADGCKFFLRDPYSPEKVGGRWYPFFLLTYNQVDGSFVAPSLVDLMEKLQSEHNETRETFVDHRRLAKPGYIATADVDSRSLERFTDAELGEIVVLKSSEGQDPRSLIMPKQTPAVDPAVYDTSVIRQDIEQVTGMQDAMRSTVVEPKTATEAQIMQQSLSGRVSAFRDSVEDWLQEIATYSAQVLLQQLEEKDVARVMGDPVTQVDPVLGTLIAVSKPYEWPKLTTEQISRLIKIKIEAGSTGAPDKQSQQEHWQQILPTLQTLIQMIIQFKVQGIPTESLEELLKETVRRFDDRIDAEKLIPQIQVQTMPPQQAAGGSSEGAQIDAQKLMSAVAQAQGAQ